MKANPGGQISLKFVIGRNEIIAYIWDVIEQQSVLITAERRIGKTTIIKKMVAEPRDGWKPVFRDLEQFHSAEEFALSVYQDIDAFLSSKGKTARRAKEIFGKLGGTEIGGVVKLPEAGDSSWKEILSSSIQDLMKELAADDDRLVFFWDELPFMLANIRDRESEALAMEVLDLLRALRQTHENLRMVFTGSVGLHHVLSSLKDANYSNAPVNDMEKVPIEPLELDSARELATKLLEGENLECENIEATAMVIAEEADCFPFYIHHIVRALKRKSGKVSADIIKATVEEQLVDSNDPWELEHFRDRISTYFDENESKVIAILDHLACEDSASIDDLLAVAKNQGDCTRDDVVKRLRLLERDHYLKKEIDGSVRFRFTLIKRWWKLYRGI